MDPDLKTALEEGRNVKVRPLAKAAGTAATTLYNAIQRKEVRAVHIGKSVRVPADEARRLLGLDQPEAA